MELPRWTFGFQARARLVYGQQAKNLTSLAYYTRSEAAHGISRKSNENEKVKPALADHARTRMGRPKSQHNQAMPKQV